MDCLQCYLLGLVTWPGIGIGLLAALWIGMAIRERVAWEASREAERRVRERKR